MLGVPQSCAVHTALDWMFGLNRYAGGPFMLLVRPRLCNCRISEMGLRKGALDVFASQTACAMHCRCPREMVTKGKLTRKSPLPSTLERAAVLCATPRSHTPTTVLS